MYLKYLLVTLILTVFCLVPNILFAFGYPSYPDGANDWHISLGLGESWYSGSNSKWYRGHLGIDLVESEHTNFYVSSVGTIDKVLRWPKCYGKTTKCDEDGCFEFDDHNHGWGPTVVIKHEYEPSYNTDGTYLEVTPAEDNPTIVYTQYGHLDSVDHLEKGQTVEKGEYLGQIGQICGWIPHLHFEIKDQAAIDYDRTYSSGAGFGYSGTDGHAPNRYIPQAFIEANKHLELPHEDQQKPQLNVESTPKPKTSLFQRIKSFFGNLFSRESDDVAGETEQTEPNVEASAEESTEDPAPEIDESPVYDATILPTDPISIAAADREVLITIAARNTGNQDWVQSEVSLNVVGGRAANSQYRHSSWLTDLRPTQLDQSRVAPGDVGTFTTLIRVPAGQSSITFTAQLVRQTGGRFVQLGSGFARVDISVGEENIIETEPEVAGEQVSDDGSDVPRRSVINRVREVVDTIEREATDAVKDVTDAVEQVTRRIFGGGGGSSNNSSEEVVESNDPPDISITTPTSSPHTLSTSTLSIVGSMNDVVTSVSVSTTASGTFSFSTTSLTWQWIGVAGAGTTTYTFVASDGVTTVSTTFTSYYAPSYELAAPVITAPTTSSVWYTNASSTEIAGTVDSRATLLTSASTSIAIITSSTWQFAVTSSIEGMTEYTVIASDNFDNTSATSSVTIVYDTTAPEITTSTMSLTSTTLSYAITATDTLAGIDMYELEIRSASAGAMGSCTDSTSTVLLASIASTSTCEWGSVASSLSSSTIELPEILQAQDIVVRMRSTDRAGNISDWEYMYLVYEAAVIEEFIPGDIVFSQIAWMGTEASAQDEWFEIYNTTGAFINVFGWYITWGDYSTSTDEYDHRYDFIPDVPPGMPPLPEELQNTFPLEPELYLVFERTDQTTIDSPGLSMVYTGDLRNSGELLQLWNADGELIDQVDMRAGWVAGDNDTKESMVRIDPTVSGNSVDNWCSFSSCPAESLAGEMQYVDVDGNPIVGSPRLVMLPDIGPPPELQL